MVHGPYFFIGLRPFLMEKGLVEDKIRETLIAISYQVPDSDSNAERPPEHVQGEEIVKPLIREGDKQYMSELISISEAPDANALPLLHAELIPAL